MTDIENVEWPDGLRTKVTALAALLREQASAVVAFSGGGDSTFLAAAARGVLGDRVLAVTAMSPSIPERELKEAESLARLIDIRHRVVVTNEMDLVEYVRNEPDRCYHCKKELFTLFQSVADEEGLACVLDGSNLDDLSDIRPGRRALDELGILSPLKECGFTKDDIRRCSKVLGLPTAAKPSAACLASRVPYGTAISADTLNAIGVAEAALHDLGFPHVRVRAHGDVARIELRAGDIAAAAAEEMRGRIAEAVKAAGFRYVALDVEGYRTGSLNEAL